MKREVLSEDMKATEIKKAGRNDNETIQGNNTHEGGRNQRIRIQYRGGKESTTLFNISLDTIIKNCNPKRTITNRAVQIVAYADGLAILARDRNSLKETTTLIEKEKECKERTL